MLNYFLAFMAVVVLNFIWAFYIKQVAAKRGLWAGFYALLIFAVNAYVVDSFVRDNTVVIPAAIGAFVGTALAVEWGKRNDKEVEETERS